jgi:hypothetical protein
MEGSVGLLNNKNAVIAEQTNTTNKIASGILNINKMSHQVTEYGVGMVMQASNSE